jgi:hypothetical protein
MFALPFVVAALVVGCDGDDQDDDLTCGPGTIERDGQCVLGEQGAAVSIASIDPVEDLVGGGATFTLIGSGFAAGGTTVRFGDAVAAITIESDTRITGTVPHGLARHVDVTVGNAQGSATVPFSYFGIYGGQGTGHPGNLYLLDPRDGSSLVIGPLVDASGTPYAVTGMEFDGTGVLYATEATRDSSLRPASLLRVDPETALVTVIGPLNDAGGRNFGSIGDITFADGALYGWAERGLRTAGDDLVAIDVTTGGVTLLADSGIPTYGGALVTLGDGSIMLAGRGAGGPTHRIEPRTGVATASVTLNGPASAGVCATTRFRGEVYAMLCYAAHMFTRIEFRTGGVTALGFPVGGIDALASNEPVATLARPPIPASPRAPMLAFAPPGCAPENVARVNVLGIDRPALSATALDARTDLIAIEGSRRGARGLPIAILLGANTGARGVEIAACQGAPLRLEASALDRVVLTTNQRGQLKAVERGGRTLVRDVRSIRVD